MGRITFILGSAFLLIVLLMAGCAHVETPPGGPEDKKSPVLTAHFPPPGATAQPVELKAVLEFSEWVDRDLQRNKIFISPALPQKLRFNFDGTRVLITSGSRLQKETTYTLTVVSSVTDLRKNAMGKSFQFQFTTGPALDSGRLSGEVNGFSGSFYFVGLYPLGPGRSELPHLTHPGQKTPEPEPHPSHERPMYLVLTDSSGRFDFSGIRPGSYAALAFHDINGNLTPDVGAEALALGPGNLDVGPLTRSLSLKLDVFDTLGLTVEKTDWTGEKKFGNKESPFVSGNVRFKGKKIFEGFSDLSASQFWVSEPGSSKPHAVSSISAHPQLAEVELWVDNLNAGSDYRVYLREDTSSGTSVAMGEFQADLEIDTLPVYFLPYSFGSGDSSIMLDRPLVFYCSKYITAGLLDSIARIIKVTLSDTMVAATVKKINHHHFELVLPPREYRGQIGAVLQVPYSTAADSLDSAGAPPPKTVAKFTLANREVWGKVQVDRADPDTPWVYTLTPVSQRLQAVKKSSNASRVVLDSLTPALYILRYFRDTNGDGRWNTGRLRPWTAQEQFIEKQDTVRVEAGKTIYVKG